MEKSISKKLVHFFTTYTTKHLAWKKVQRKLHDKETDINASEEEP